jgi:OOP family OmpA-OmpF porin
MKLRSALLAATVLALPIAAQAQPVTGLYVGAGAGINWNLQENLKNLSFPAVAPLHSGVATSGNLKSSVGVGTAVSLGWGFGNGLRAEVQGAYMWNHISGFTNTGLVGGGTNEQKYGGFGNVFYDFVGLAPWIQPYVGAGVGVLAVNENLHAYNTGGAIGGVSLAPGAVSLNNVDGTKVSFAYQAILGAAFPIAPVPGLAFTAEYRFVGTAGNRSYSGTASVTSGGHTLSTPASLTLGPSYNNQILLGLRYNFGVAPPPPPPPVAAPAPAPARSYLVFFDWDKATLTDRARQIISEAAANSTKVQYTRIEVNGYTDTSGTPQYNMGLSVRRAQAVAAELVKDGVPKAAIAIQGFGETHLLVPTGPGVREPQNRRVEIIIR